MDWQPIETAPRGKVFIAKLLTAHKKIRVAVAYISSETGLIMDSGGVKDLTDRATHWVDYPGGGG